MFHIHLTTGKGKIRENAKGWNGKLREDKNKNHKKPKKKESKDSRIHWASETA